MHLAISNSPVEAAWAAFDTAALQLQRVYGPAAAIDDTPAKRQERMELALTTARLWAEFQALFVGGTPDEPKSVA